MSEKPLPADIIVYGVLIEVYSRDLKLTHKDFIKRVQKLEQSGVDVSNVARSTSYSEDLSLLVGLLGPSKFADSNPAVLTKSGVEACCKVLGKYLKEPDYVASANKLLENLDIDYKRIVFS